MKSTWYKIYFLIFSLHAYNLTAMDFLRKKLRRQSNQPQPSTNVVLNKKTMDFIVAYAQDVLIEAILQDQEIVVRELMTQWTDLIQEGGEASLLNLNYKNKDGITIMTAALLKKNERVKTTLIEDTKLDIDIQDNAGQSMLAYAVIMDDKDMVQKLLNRKAKIDLVDTNLKTPLITACYLRYYEIIELLCSVGAQINAVDADGNTPLMILVSYPEKENEMIKAYRFLGKFLSYNPNIDMQNNKGKTALMFATEQGDVIKISLLLAAGADATLEDEQGRTVIDYVPRDEGTQNVTHYFYIRQILLGDNKLRKQDPLIRMEDNIHVLQVRSRDEGSQVIEMPIEN